MAELLRPFWSIVMPVRGRQKWLGEALSVPLAEPDAEVLLQENPVYRQYPVSNQMGLLPGYIKYEANSEDLGLYGSLNRAIERSQGDWIHVLHADDWTSPHFYQRMRREIEQHPEADIVFCPYQNIRDGKVGFAPTPFQDGRQGLSFRARLRRGNPLQQVAVVFSRRAWERVGPYRTDLPYCADWEWFIRAELRGLWWHLPETMAYYREHGDQGTCEMFRSGVAQANLETVRREIEQIP